MELDTGDSLYALLSMRLALLPCLAFLKRRLTPHPVADTFSARLWQSRLN